LYSSSLDTFDENNLLLGNKTEAQTCSEFNYRIKPKPNFVQRQYKFDEEGIFNYRIKPKLKLVQQQSIHLMKRELQNKPQAQTCTAAVYKFDEE
jgi:hypothetical protein